ncbi:DNA-binding protein [Paenibacillus sp. FSL K6-2859]|uniref:DNA-binding protein n=1 Tax=Paenibacillus sp. FSL K6-2859 TaxID=2921482 RepID=UPI0030F95DB7
MSKALFDLTQQQINMGYEERNEGIIEKETEFLFNMIYKTFLVAFSDKVIGIKMDMQVLSLSQNYLFSDEHKGNLMKWLNRFSQMEHPASDLDFGKLKIDFEIWYTQLGGQNIEFVFSSNYLLTTSQAAKALNISQVTVQKYIKQGLDCVNTEKHRKIPKYAIELLKDPIYGLRMQILAQEKKKGTKSKEERAKEIALELMELQLKYKAKTIKEAFADYDGDEMDDPTDYHRWLDLDEELAEIMKLSGGINDAK